MKKVLVTGASGLVGSRFVELFKHKYVLFTPDYPKFDITDFSKTQKLIKEIHPDIIVNFAAYTNVSEAENQRGDKNGGCWKINTTGVENLIEGLSGKVRLIHISTDMVFPGSKENPGPYDESQMAERTSDKVTWYGYTKGEAERIVLGELAERATILRLIYPFSAHYDMKVDYVRKPLDLFDNGKLYPMFYDQQVSVVFVDDVANTVDKLIESGKTGTFHASSSDTTTPFKLVSYVIEKTRGVKNVVKHISVDEFVRKMGNSVRYPKFGGLKVAKTEKELGVKFGTWRQMVDKFVDQL